MPIDGLTDQLATRATRRTVVKTGAKLAYAAPLVAATMKLGGGIARAAISGGIPGVCTAGNDPENGSPWVVCRADATSAWVSANNWGEYHVQQICQSLGYATVDAFGGTCGNVCGYCEGDTSCQSTGNEYYDGAGDCGTDAYGQVVCYTVHWRCVG